MEITTKCPIEEWNNFLKFNDEATIYHTAEWKVFLEMTFGYKSQYQFIKDDNKDLVGILPLFYINSLLNGRYLSCVPFSHQCGYIGDSSINHLLFNNIYNIYNNFNIDYIEIRNSINITDFKYINWYFNILTCIIHAEDKRQK